MLLSKPLEIMIVSFGHFDFKPILEKASNTKWARTSHGHFLTWQEMPAAKWVESCITIMTFLNLFCILFYVTKTWVFHNLPIKRIKYSAKYLYDFPVAEFRYPFCNIAKGQIISWTWLPFFLKITFHLVSVYYNVVFDFDPLTILFIQPVM